MFRLVAIFIVLSVLGGCARVTVAEGDGKTYRFLGYVEVELPETEKKIEAVRLQSLGVALESGLSVGWRESEQVLVPLKDGEGEGAPLEATCSMVVIVRSDAEAKHAREILSDLKGENICLTLFQ